MVTCHEKLIFFVRRNDIQPSGCTYICHCPDKENEFMINDTPLNGKCHIICIAENYIGTDKNRFLLAIYFSNSLALSGFLCEIGFLMSNLFRESGGVCSPFTEIIHFMSIFKSVNQ